MNYVIIPCWKRAEFLAVCLKHIQNAIGFEKCLYYFAVDRGYDEEVMGIINQFNYKKIVRIAEHKYKGNSFNILTAFKEVYEISNKRTDLIFLIEEDIFVAEDFFLFHEKIQHQVLDTFFVSACFNQNIKYKLKGKWNDIYKHTSYQSLGVSFKIDNIGIINSYVTEDYYQDMNKYVINKFPNLKVKYAEQDSLIHYIIIDNKFSGVYPILTRAFHAGFVGYNRLGKEIDQTLPLSKRIEMLYHMDQFEMNERAFKYKDIKVCEMKSQNIQEYKLIEIKIPFNISIRLFLKRVFNIFKLIYRK